MTNSRSNWPHWANLVLGIWLFASPWALGVAGETTPAIVNAWLCGAAIVVFAALAAYTPKVWEEAINVLVGVWLAISPWVLGYAGQQTLLANAVIVGALVVALTIWALVAEGGWDRLRGAHNGA